MISRRQQLSLSGFTTKTKHGGSLVAGRRKTARPIATKRPMHVVLKSSMAKGRLSLHQKRKEIDGLIHSLAGRFYVRVIAKSNNGNHIHLLVQAQEREGFKRFLMALSGRVAQLMTGARKGVAQVEKFWDAIPFTRIVEWGRDLWNAKRYLVLNYVESVGLAEYEPRLRAKSRMVPLGP